MRKITELEEIQSILFDGLSYFDEVCKKYNLTYYLSNGTLLGAVKYGGFIPWDDDVDVFMPRADYERLMCVPDFDNGTYELMAKEKNEKWRVTYAKMKDKRTFVKETTADFGIDNGLAVDIFPLDHWDEDKAVAVKTARYCGLQRRFLTASIEASFTTPRKGSKRILLYFIWKYSHFMGHECFYQRIQNVIEKGRRLKNPTYVGSVAWSLYGIKEVLPARIFSETVEVSFGGKLFKAPVGYDEYLRILYGAYEQDPPLEKQKSHHDIHVWWRDDNE